MSSFKLHKSVIEDLDGTWSYVAGEASPEVASKLEDEFFDAFELLSTQPHMGFQGSILRLRSLCFWIIREYLIAYTPHHDPLLIIAVLHGKHHPRTIARILTERQ
jgi:plasmid stabilization system protein ParE